MRIEKLKDRNAGPGPLYPWPIWLRTAVEAASTDSVLVLDTTDLPAGRTPGQANRALRAYLRSHSLTERFRVHTRADTLSIEYVPGYGYSKTHTEIHAILDRLEKKQPEAQPQRSKIRNSRTKG